MSSLQRAMLKGKQTETAADRSGAATNAAATSRGHFENCFAQGLDLSELGGTATNSTGPATTGTGSTSASASASADLLKMKQLEQQQHFQNEMQERQLEQAVQQRISTISQSLLLETRNSNKDEEETKKRIRTSLFSVPSSPSASSINDVLIHMHGSDDGFIHDTERRRGGRGGNRQLTKKMKKQVKNNNVHKHSNQVATAKTTSVIKGKRKTKY
jgi:hypothetical protein